ncbi:hypothetical protein M2333_001600 [Sphingobium sp. B11D3B]|uniref:hypothetical protein n=1 Tax=Sphingobium sp. B11D3B TaxID=2940575 RepID=UPI0022270B17|nr:hypothetical protein [Sphingobium sp. B11D3B]MCW2388554.1 hypothetical protein [Sphingobium sp. B11D3B]
MDMFNYGRDGMLRKIAGLALGSCIALTAMPAMAQQSCTRTALEEATQSYVAAQQAGNPSLIKLAPDAKLQEQMEPITLAAALLNKPQKIDFHRAIHDTQGCESFVEVIITDPAHPYVLGTRIKLTGDLVREIETLVTDADDWLFKASNTLAYSRAEKWDMIPMEKQGSRETIIAAADAYLNLFNDPTVRVPWGSPCARLEGGIYTAKGAPGVVSKEDSCAVGVPKNTPLVDRRYLVDQDLGSVVVLLRFGNSSLPDSHLFRVENGLLRYVHTITVCKTLNCGFPVKPIPNPPRG